MSESARVIRVRGEEGKVEKYLDALPSSEDLEIDVAVDAFPSVNLFTDAMKQELKRHSAEKGDTWLTSDTVEVRGEGPGGDTTWRVSMEEWLHAVYRNAVRAYEEAETEEARADQEIDIANILALIWTRRRLR